MALIAVKWLMSIIWLLFVCEWDTWASTRLQPRSRQWEDSHTFVSWWRTPIIQTSVVQEVNPQRLSVLWRWMTMRLTCTKKNKPHTSCSDRFLWPLMDYDEGMVNKQTKWQFYVKKIVGEGLDIFCGINIAPDIAHLPLPSGFPVTPLPLAWHNLASSLPHWTSYLNIRKNPPPLRPNHSIRTCIVHQNLASPTLTEVPRIVWSNWAHVVGGKTNFSTMNRNFIKRT